MTLEGGASIHRTLVVGVMVIVIVAVAAGGAVSWALRPDGVSEGATPAVNRLASEAVTNADDAPDLAALLAIEAARRSGDLASGEGEAARNALVTTLTTHARLVSEFQLGDDAGAVAVTFSADGRRIAASSRVGTIRSWDIARHAEIGRRLTVGPACGDADVDDLRYSSDGSTIVHVNCYSATVIAADTMRRRSRQGLVTDDEGEEEVWVEIAPDATTLAVDGDYAGFRFLDPSTGRRSKTGAAVRRDLRSAHAFSSDGRALAATIRGATSSGAGRFGVIDTRDGSTIGALPEHPVALGRGGAFAVLAPTDAPFILWDVRRGKQLATLLEGAGRPVRAEFDRAGKQLAVSTDDGVVHVFRIGSRGAVRETASFEHRGVVGMRFSPGAALLATAGLDGKVRLWDIGSRVALAKRVDDAGPYAVAFQPRGPLLAAATGDELVLWTTSASGAARIVQRTTTEAANLAFSADGERLATGGGDLSGVVRFWSVSDGGAAPAGRVEADEYFVADVAFVPDGTRLLTAGGNLRAFRADDHAPVTPHVKGTVEDGFLLAVPSPDGRTLVTAAGVPDVLGRGKLQIRDLESGRLLRPPAPADINSALFLEGGTVLVTGDDAGRLSYRDVPTLALLTAFVAHPDPGVWSCCAGVTGLALTADGRTLVTSGLDDAIRLWDARTSQPLGLALSTLPLASEDRATPRDVTVSGSGRLASADDDGTYLWDPVLLSTRLEDWQARLCRRAGRNLTALEWRRFLPDEEYSETCPGL